MANIIEELGRQYPNYEAKIRAKEKELQEYLEMNKKASEDVLSFLRELNSHDYIKGYAEILGQGNKRRGIQVYRHKLRKGIPGDYFGAYLSLDGEPSFWITWLEDMGIGAAQDYLAKFNDEGIGKAGGFAYNLYLSEYVGLTKDEIGRFKRSVWSNLRNVAQRSLEDGLIDAVVLDRLKLGRMPYELIE